MPASRRGIDLPTVPECGAPIWAIGYSRHVGTLALLAPEGDRMKLFAALGIFLLTGCGDVGCLCAKTCGRGQR